MSQSMYLTVYFRKKYNESEFRNNLEKAREIFRAVWPKLGSGFTKEGNINGLYEYYQNCEWNSDAEELKEEGDLKILRLSKPMNEDGNYSFNFHNYGGHTLIYTCSADPSQSVDLRDIYLVFAEILSSCFGYLVKVGDSHDEEEYTCVFDEDGKKYQMIEDRSDYINAIRDMVEAGKSIKENKDKLKEAEKLIKKYENNNSDDDSEQ